MILTIDTTRDSHLEIRKAIRMLMSLVGEGGLHTNEPLQQNSRNVFENPAAETGSVLGALFGDDNKSSAPTLSQAMQENEGETEKYDLELY